MSTEAHCQHLRYRGAQVSCGTGVWIPGACFSDLGPGVMGHSSDLDSVCPEDGGLKSRLWPLQAVAEHQQLSPDDGK